MLYGPPNLIASASSRACACAAIRAALATSPHPVEDLAAQHNLSASQIRNLIHACRHKRGMLTPASPGRAGGELTARAIELLREH